MFSRIRAKEIKVFGIDFYLVFIFILCCFGSQQCSSDDEADFSDDISKFLPCDNTNSIYGSGGEGGDGEHFFNKNFIDEDGSLNHKKWWFHSFKSESSPCDPLNTKNKSLAK